MCSVLGRNALNVERGIYLCVMYICIMYICTHGSLYEGWSWEMSGGPDEVTVQYTLIIHMYVNIKCFCDILSIYSCENASQ